MTRKLFYNAALLSLLIFALTGFETLAARSIEKAPVITYMRKGSQEAPYITGIHIYDNGRVLLIDKADGTGSRYIFIPKVQVQNLMDMIIRKQDFFSITEADIRAFQNSREIVLDAATTYIAVWGRAGFHRLSIYNFFKDTKVSTEKMIRLRKIVSEMEKILTETVKKLR